MQSWAMLLFIASTSTSLAPPPSPQLQATATVQVVRAAPVNSNEWARTPKQSRREIVVRDKEGRQMLLRLVEYQ